MTTPADIQKISVIISTCNRAPMLAKCLARVAAAERPANAVVEVVVVDNNSTDDTRDIVREFRTALPEHDIIYVFEQRQGLSYARNAGIRKASGDLLVFTDDDCFVDASWLASIEREFSGNGDLAGAGGRVELHDERDLPITIRTGSVRKRAATDNLFNLVLGCNMCFRRSVFDEIGLFDVRFGAGTPIHSAEDMDMVYRALKSGKQVDYIPEIVVYHAHGRRQAHDVLALMKLYLIGRGAFYFKHILHGDIVVLKLYYWEVRNQFASLIRNRTGRIPPYQVIANLLQGSGRYARVSLRQPY